MYERYYSFTLVNTLVNHLDSKGNYMWQHWIIRSCYTCRWWVGCEEGPGRAVAPPSSLLAVPNVTTHPLTASVPITIAMMVRCSVVLMWQLKGYDLIRVVTRKQTATMGFTTYLTQCGVADSWSIIWWLVFYRDIANFTGMFMCCGEYLVNFGDCIYSSERM